MHDLRDLSDRIERLVLRHEELKRTNNLLEQEVQALSADRDSLRSRLSAARARVDALLHRLPQDGLIPASAALAGPGAEATDVSATASATASPTSSPNHEAS